MDVAYHLIHNFRKAARGFKISLRLAPHNTIVLNNMGTVYDSLQEYKHAKRMYRRALKYSPRSAIILKNLGTSLLAQHKYNKGWDAYQKALAIDPQLFADTADPKTQNPASLEQRGAMNYYLALGCARAGYTDCAFQYLRMTFAEGFTTAQKVARENDFAGLHNNPAFQQLLVEQKQKRVP